MSDPVQKPTYEVQPSDHDGWVYCTACEVNYGVAANHVPGDTECLRHLVTHRRQLEGREREAIHDAEWKQKALDKIAEVLEDV